MKPLHSQIHRARSQWNRALLTGLAGSGLGVALLLAGCAVLIGRASGVYLEVPALIAGLAAGLGWAGWRFRSRRVQNEQIATLLDLRRGGDGRLLFALETGSSALPEDGSGHGTQLAGLTRPRPDLRRVARALLPGAAFFAAALLVPLRLPAQQGTDPVSEQRLEELESLATALEEVLQLDEDLHDEVEENLAALTSEDQRARPEGDVLREALDRMESRLEQAAEDAAANLEEIAREAAAAAQAAASEDPAERAAALEQLAELARELSATAGPESQALDPELLARLAEAGLSPEVLAQLGALPDLSALGQLANQLDPATAQQLAAAAAGALSEAALEKLAQMAREGLLGPAGEGGEFARSATGDESLAELLARLEEAQALGGGT